MRHGSTQRGNVAVIVALSLVVLLGAAALAIDVGYARLVRVELENAADAAAHAGVRQLDGTDEGVAAAVASAIEIAAANKAAGEAVVVTEADVVTGAWDFETRTFTASTDGAEVNSLLVQTARPELGLLVGPAVGRDAVAVSAESGSAADLSGASATDCFIPVAVPLCLIEHHGGLGKLQDVTLNLNPPAIDNVGWARPHANANASWSKSQIRDCSFDGKVEIGDPAYLQNGVAHDVLAELATELSSSPTRWSNELWGTQPGRMSASAINATNYGKTFEGIVMVFDGGPEYCVASGGSFTGNYPIAGFMWGAVYDVRTSGSAHDRTIRIRLDVTGKRGRAGGSTGGGPDYGVSAFDAPKRVR